MLPSEVWRAVITTRMNSLRPLHHRELRSALKAAKPCLKTFQGDLVTWHRVGIDSASNTAGRTSLSQSSRRISSAGLPACATHQGSVMGSPKCAHASFQDCQCSVMVSSSVPSQSNTIPCERVHHG